MQEARFDYLGIFGESPLDTLQPKVISGVKWSYFSNFLARGIQPLTLIVLTRLLTPEDFGVMAMALTVTGFIRLFKDVGLGQALIQHRGQTEEVADTVFWLHLLFGIVWLGSVWIAAPFVATYYHREEVTPILRTLGLLFVVYPFSDVPLNILVRDLEFRALFFRQVAPLLFSSSVSIVLAYVGFGVWALVFGSLVGAVATAIVVLRVSDWRPGFRYNIQILANVLKFGTHVSIQNIFGWLTMSVDQVFVGRFLGAQSLGVYRMGFILGDMPWSLISGPFNTVLYPVLCKAGVGVSVVKRQYLSFLRWASLLNIPAGVALMFLAPSFVPLLLSQKWAGVTPVLQLIALAGVIASLVTMNPEAYKAIGRPDIMSKFFLVRLMVSVPLYYFAAQRSTLILAATHVVLAFLFGPINMFICMRILHIRMPELLSRMKGSLAMGTAFVAVGTLYHLGVTRLAIAEPMNGAGLFGFFLLAGIAVLWFFDRAAIRQLTEIIRPRRQVKIEG
jgi:O-antigen/teichoic acid export membrane protein